MVIVVVEIVVDEIVLGGVEVVVMITIIVEKW